MIGSSILCVAPDLPSSCPLRGDPQPTDVWLLLSELCFRVGRGDAILEVKETLGKIENVVLTPINEPVGIPAEISQRDKRLRGWGGNPCWNSRSDLSQLATQWNEPPLLPDKKKKSNFWRGVLKTGWIWKFCQGSFPKCYFFSLTFTSLLLKILT